MQGVQEYILEDCPHQPTSKRREIRWRQGIRKRSEVVRDPVEKDRKGRDVGHWVGQRHDMVDRLRS